MFTACRYGEVSKYAEGLRRRPEAIGCHFPGLKIKIRSLFSRDGYALSLVLKRKVTLRERALWAWNVFLFDLGARAFLKTRSAFVGHGKSIGDSAQSTFEPLAIASHEPRNVSALGPDCTNRTELEAILSAEP